MREPLDAEASRGSRASRYQRLQVLQDEHPGGGYALPTHCTSQLSAAYDGAEPCLREALGDPAVANALGAKR